ncbi:MAG: universal stress protein [Halieaceae bacterium]|nr:universal stress protein [Halieaceae bacterium]
MALDKFMVILDPTSEQQPAFERALASCHMTGARLHVYACLGTGQADQTSPSAVDKFQALFNGCVDRARNEGIEVTGELEWAADWRMAAVEAAARSSASMIFKHYTPHSDVEREIRTTYDWTLLRLAPCPVLMIKNRRDWKNRRVLAAVCPDASSEAHQKLNNQIISFAQRFSDAYGSEAHIISAFEDLRHQPRVDTIAESCGIAEEFVHVVKGRPADAIRETAEDIGADLILIGTVGRSGIRGTIVGNTSERLLDHTPSDVLVLN